MWFCTAAVLTAAMTLTGAAMCMPTVSVELPVVRRRIRVEVVMWRLPVAVEKRKGVKI